jgi:transcriptional regulator with XRE-family HTH domain
MRAIVAFLGYAPFPESRSLAGLLLAKRRKMGWSIRKAAAAIGVDPATLADWERGRVILFRKHRAMISRVLNLPEAEVARVMAAARAASVAHVRPSGHQLQTGN